MWSETRLPNEIIQIICNQLSEETLTAGTVGDNEMKPETRISSISWIPEGHWITGFIMHYVSLHNKLNYHYDLSGGISKNQLQYSEYGPGHHYTWHNDEQSAETLLTEPLRKLSFSLQLSHPDEYEGGELQFLSGTEMYTAPKTQGTLITFKSNTQHRVRPIKSGLRKSIVGWITGPAWK